MVEITGNVPFNCPHCGKPQDDTVGDYVLLGERYNESIATHECGWCDGEFSVARINDDQQGREVYQVLK